MQLNSYKIIKRKCFSLFINNNKSKAILNKEILIKENNCFSYFESKIKKLSLIFFLNKI